MIHHIHVYKVKDLYELEVEAEDVMQAKQLATSLVGNNITKLKPQESDCEYISLGYQEVWGHIPEFYR